MPMLLAQTAFILAALVASSTRAGSFVRIEQGKHHWSGTVISLDGKPYVFTCAHNYDDSKPVDVFLSKTLMLAACKIFALDGDRDLGLIELPRGANLKTAHPIRLADTCPEPCSCNVKVIGYGKGRCTERVTRLGELQDVTLSGAAPRELPTHEATVNPGDSGGAVLHGGKLIGVTAARLNRNGDGIFVPVEEVRAFLEENSLGE